MTEVKSDAFDAFAFVMSTFGLVGVAIVLLPIAVYYRIALVPLCAMVCIAVVIFTRRIIIEYRK